jgi:alpha-tubulin suppressor-like RCC1 family protein
LSASAAGIGAALLLLVSGAHADPLRARKVVAGADHACALLQDRSIKCWGSNARGQLGLGDQEDRGDDAAEMGDDLPIVDIASANSTTDLALGADHGCAIFGKGILKCWGANTHGQLGLGHTNDLGDDPGEMGAQLPVVNVAPNRMVKSVAAGAEHTCAILDDDSVKCWGSNDSGQLGLGDTRTRGDDAFEMGMFLPTVDLGPGRTARQITAGMAHTCAKLDDGTIKCWGGNFDGQLGIGTTFNRGDDPREMSSYLPELDFGGRSALHVTSGNDHNCALLDDDGVKCWGRNDHGQLGLGHAESWGDEATETTELLPYIELDPSYRLISRVAAGSFHSCAIGGGRLLCWGHNDSGQLGLGDTADRGDQVEEMGSALLPVDLGAGRVPVQVTAGWRFTCVRSSGDRIQCWGANEAGQLGYGDRTIRGRHSDDMGEALPFVDLGSE